MLVFAFDNGTGAGEMIATTHRRRKSYAKPLRTSLSAVDEAKVRATFGATHTSRSNLQVSPAPYPLGDQMQQVAL